MYYPPHSCMLLFFLVSLFYHLPCVSSKQGPGWCETQFQCGNITASFPFWGGNRPEACGHPSLELRCNSKNIISLKISNYEYNVLHIDQTSNTLRLARADLLGSFCSATFSSTTLPPDIFELLPTYENLTIFYLCNPRLTYLSSLTCPGRAPVSAYSSNYHRTCRESFTLYVPTGSFPEMKELKLTHLESVLRKGFEVKLKILACQECSSSDYEHYSRCSQPFSCGDKRGLLYPFWIPGRGDCGHPELKLDCSRGFAEISVSTVPFRILDVNYDSGIVRLARWDYINGSCNPVNAQFIQSVLTFRPDTQLLIVYHDCAYFPTFDIPTDDYVRSFDCKDDKKNVMNLYVMKNNNSSASLYGSSGLLSEDLRKYCEKEVSIPVSSSSFNTLMGHDGLTKMVEQGFELELNQDCSMCIESKGACGYDQTSKRFVCYCNDGTHGRICDSGKRSHATLAKEIRIVSYSVAGVAVFLVLLALFLVYLRKRKTRLREKKLQALIPLQHYTYAQVKRITKSFAEVVGKGGFGIVYKGTLSNGRMVAVKVLKDLKGNGEDFTNEVASMSQTSHLNIVSLLGFCAESSRRAIIYEFLGNGSLDKFISGKTSTNLDSNTLYRIALGVARGLEYLHHSCKTRIVHFDIKPQNVLLDANFCPKVSDFGLAKLCEKKESALSLLDTRGTVGYIAPEMVSRAYGSVSHKSDVYSYGMLVLEMIGARNKERSQQDFASNASSMYFPEWVYRDLELGNSKRLIEIGINKDEEEVTKKMTLVGLWCIQSSPSDRPPMNRVVEMMEGSLDALEVPPRPILQQILPSLLQESTTLSDDTTLESLTPKHDSSI